MSDDMERMQERVLEGEQPDQFAGGDFAPPPDVREAKATSGMGYMSKNRLREWRGSLQELVRSIDSVLGDAPLPPAPAIEPERERLYRELIDRLGSTRWGAESEDRVREIESALGRNADGTWSEPLPATETAGAVPREELEKVVGAAWLWTCESRDGFKEDRAAVHRVLSWLSSLPSPAPPAASAEQDEFDYEYPKGREVNHETIRRALSSSAAARDKAVSDEVREAMSWLAVCANIADNFDAERGDRANIQRTGAALATLRRALGLGGGEEGK